MKAAILFDSSAYLTTPLNTQPNLFQVDFTLSLPSDEIITESIDENHLEAFFKDWMKEGTPQPKTAQPSIKDYHHAFEEIIEAGYDTVFGVFLSSSVSGTFQTAESVSQEYRDQLQIINFDAIGLSVNTEQLIEQLSNMIDAKLPVDQITKAVNWLIEQSQFFIAVEKNDHLIQGGRGAALNSLEKSAFKTLPVLEYVADSTPILHEVFRTIKRRNNRLAEIAVAYKKKYPNHDLLVSIGHTLAEDKAENLKHQILALLPNQAVAIRMIGTAFCSHLGSGALSFGLMPVLKETQFS